jgi:membrane-associated phospholipid phosphatase
VHWPIDIVGGTVVAAISAAGAYFASKWIVSTWQTKQQARQKKA